jgi:SAM-dependent methyltransferase
MEQLYDEIGGVYRSHRAPDSRIAAAIGAALGRAGPVVNVGAGAGSYEPLDRRVVAVEPAWTMIRQRPAGSAPVVQADAARLPFRDGAFGAALAVLTVHHWADRPSGLAELGRVARGPVVILTWDPSAAGFWLVRDYFPDLMAIDRRIFPSIEEIGRSLGPTDVQPVRIPHDCTDGFLGAYWRRPHAYLDPGVRAAISTFSKLDDARPGLANLRADLESGAWASRNADLLDRLDLDLGYRLVVARGRGGAPISPSPAAAEPSAAPRPCRLDPEEAAQGGRAAGPGVR